MTSLRASWRQEALAGADTGFSARAKRMPEKFVGGGARCCMEKTEDGCEERLPFEGRPPGGPEIFLDFRTVILP